MSKIQSKSTVIQTIEQLREYLKIAMKLEHATIPPYLTTAYTADFEGKNKLSYDILRGVAKEEMLHLALAGNLLNAIGGQPDLTSNDFVPQYPTHLPTGVTTFEVNIEKFSPSAIKTFLKIERPAPLPQENHPSNEYIKNVFQIQSENLHKSITESNNPFVPLKKRKDGNFDLHYNIVMIPHNKLSPKRQQAATKSFLPSVKVNDSNGNEIELHYWSIGEFYRAISLGFMTLSNSMKPEALFCGDPKRQIPTKLISSMGGHGIIVTDIKSALAAIEQIAGQGEGAHGSVYDNDDEIAHYYKFDQIKRGRCYRDPKKLGSHRDRPGKPQGEVFHVDFSAVHQIKKNAKLTDYIGHKELEENALLFNGTYKQFLATLNDGFNGQPEKLNSIFTSSMFEIKTAMYKLIHCPIPDTNENASPTFEMNYFKYPI